MNALCTNIAKGVQPMKMKEGNKMPNPANEASQAAKKAGLSYWDYMEKTFPGCVQKFVWGAKKETRKEEREVMSGLEKMLDRSNLPGMKALSHMRNLVGKRSAYKSM